MSAPALAAAASPLLHEQAAVEHLEHTYHPSWARLFVHEAAGNGHYPLPAADEINDLLFALRGTSGIAVSASAVNGKSGVVSEGQGYAMLSAGMRRDVDLLKGLAVAWQAQVQGVAGDHACGACCGVGDHRPAAQLCTRAAHSLSGLCRRVAGTDMPAWTQPLEDEGSLGSATDGDEDGVTGLIYLAELLDDDEVREYAVASILAFVLEDLGLADPAANSRPVPEVGDVPIDLQIMYLWRGGSCWGGYDDSATGYGASNRNLCIAPAYFSPGQWRLFARYVTRHADLVPPGYSAAQIAQVLQSAITWGYNTLNRISCDNGLVSNWWSLPAGRAWPWQGHLGCANSATTAGAYGADAVRIPWRVVLDYLWFGESANAPLFDENGRLLGAWGAKEYANRWAGAWREAVRGVVDYKGDPLAHPPYEPGAERLRPDQVLPLLSKLAGCSLCPQGMTASPWNGWGSYPIVTTFQVPLDGVDRAEMQEWLDVLAQLSFDGTAHDGYFDLGTQVVVSAMLGGDAWNPLDYTAPLAPPAPSPQPSPRPMPHRPPPPVAWSPFDASINDAIVNGKDVTEGASLLEDREGPSATSPVKPLPAAPSAREEPASLAAPPSTKHRRKQTTRWWAGWLLGLEATVVMAVSVGVVMAHRWSKQRVIRWHQLTCFRVHGQGLTELPAIVGDSGRETDATFAESEGITTDMRTKRCERVSVLDLD